MLQSDTCEICGKQALYICSECKWSAYCSRQHQLQHWKVHRDHCTILSSYQQRKQENEINKQRSELRKKYFESFSHKIFDNCSSLAEEMVQLEKKLIKNSREIFNQMEYGISMCLLARSFLNVRNEPRAAITINSYLEQKLHFLKDMRDIINFESTMAKQPSNKDKNSVKTPKNMDSALSNSSILQNNTIQDNLTNPISVLRQFSIKKVSLIASVANIVYAVKQPVIPIYQIYTEHIEKMFGQNSLQTSNCYFMIGSHYKENNQYYKSIACFMRAAQMRGSMAGDCYYNLGILFHLLKKPKIALMMFENAAKLRENQFSENSSEVADVYHNIALIHRSMGNFKGAIQNLQKIALIYSKDKNSPQYKNAKSSIKQLQAAFRSHMQKTNQIALTTALMKDLKKTIRKVSKGQQDGLSENSFRSDKDMHEKQRLSGDNNYLRLTDQLVNKLNPLQSFHLSQLQIQLGKCQTMFMAANTLGTSHFLKIIKLSKLEELIKENQLIFKNVSIQMLSKRGIKDINMILS